MSINAALGVDIHVQRVKSMGCIVGIDVSKIGVNDSVNLRSGAKSAQGIETQTATHRTGDIPTDIIGRYPGRTGANCTYLYSRIVMYKMGVKVQAGAFLVEYWEFEVDVEIADVHRVNSIAVERAPLREAGSRTCCLG